MKKSNYSYGAVPMVYHSRSKFDLSFSHKTTGNVGDLMPLYCQEIYPGDSFKCDANVVARVTSSFLKPVIDNLFCDVMFFFVPSRTVYNRFQEVFGENNESAYAQPEPVDVPVMSSGVDTGGNVPIIAPGSIGSYLGLPVGNTPSDLFALGGINVLPFRAFAKIYNEWFRDENLVAPVNIQFGEIGTNEFANNNAFSSDNYTGMCPKVSKMHDYFTQVLPSPQKGDAVSVKLGRYNGGLFPVITSATSTNQVDPVPLQFSFVNKDLTVADGNYPIVSNTGSFSTPQPGSNASQSFTAGLHTSVSTMATLEPEAVYPSNLSTVVPAVDIGGTSVNDLRFAFQLQKMLERDAIFGTRYTEYLQGHFGVTSPDARLQRSEFLGGRRFPLNVFQQTQTSQATSDSPLGNVAGWSLSNGRAGYTKGFTEHGYVIGVVCVRQFHTYQQGVEKFWWRKKRTDFLDPLFTTIGYQPVYKKELDATYSSDVQEDTVFGYAPAFEDLRCRQNRISGQLSSASKNGLDIWHFGDYYANPPVLGQQWIEETSTYVDRALSASSSVVDNFIFDIYFKQYAIRVMPTYGMPGLIDHH